MRVRQFGSQAVIFGLVVAAGSTFGAGMAAAKSQLVTPVQAETDLHYAVRHVSLAQYYRGNGTLQCVPFARDNTGIEIVGNAATWWNSAQGVYARGSKPEIGSILNFRATGRMRLGHVAVVSNVIDGRNIQIDHANWSGPGGISRNVSVVDVSPRNDWTAVRVQLTHSDDFGSVYPTYGFIYGRPDRGAVVANNTVAPPAFLNTAPGNLRINGRSYLFTASLQEMSASAEELRDPRLRFFRQAWSRASEKRSYTGRLYAGRTWAGRARMTRVHTRNASQAPHRGNSRT